jgi:hypothetical protein
MRLSQSLAAIFLCAAALTLPPAVSAANARPTQKPRAKAQTPAPHTEITKEKIEAIVSVMEQGVKKKEVAAIAPYLAPDLRWRFRSGDKPVGYANREQYIANVKRGFELALDYTYLRKSLTISVAPDGQSATAQLETFEMMTLEQGTFAASSISEITFKIYKGKILVASVEGTITPV